MWKFQRLARLNCRVCETSPVFKKIHSLIATCSKGFRVMRAADEDCSAARALFAEGKSDAARTACRNVLLRQPQHVGSIRLLAEIAVVDNDLEQALDLYAKALGIDPNDSLTHYKIGNLQKDSGLLEAALASYDVTVALDPRHNRAFCNRGVVLQRLKRPQAALASFEKAITLNPEDALSHYNHGALLREMSRLQEALKSYSQAVAISPGYVEALCNRGMLLQELGEWDAALIDFERAIELRPGFAEPHYRRADLLVRMKQYAAAIVSYDEAIACNPTLRFAVGMRRQARMHLCDWGELTADTQLLTAANSSTAARATPFTIMALTDFPPLHHRSAQDWVNEHHPPDDSLGAPPRREAGGRIRLGYFSADFCEHPVAVLAAQFLELHDRSKYEVIGFSFGPDTQDPMRKRLEKAFDRFLEVRGKSDREVALLARSEGIDIAIDLNGHTAGSRTGIFALRAAPVQISFLGYPGTMGAGYIDYLIADATVIPEESTEHYSEKILHLPDSFLPHDSGRVIGAHRFTREELGLPPGGMVFCCFNNSYKIMPGTFESWMKILGRVDGSVLWLSQHNATAMENLRREARSRGIDPGRLLFAERVPSSAEHLARLGAADLFLDTLPYNAHATALDALWAGLPLLTCIGRGFAGRVAASLLKAIGLPELITATAAQYEDLAVELAVNPQRLAAIRLKLAQNRLATPLFDTARLTRNLERAYARVLERSQAGLPPQHLYPT